MKRLAILIIPVLLLLLLPTAALAKTTPDRFDKALDKLYQQGYPQALEEYFVTLGTNPELGFRWAGTSAELAAAQRTFRELKSAGLRGVKYEAVPADVFEFKYAGVTTETGLDFIASSFAGTPPTGKRGVTAKVVYVGNGTKAAFDAAEAVAGPVAGKLVLMDLDFGTAFWMSLPGAEAAHRGALGVIMTYGDGGYYWYADDALGSFDATYQYDWAPMVYVSKTDGDVLRAQVQAAMAARSPTRPPWSATPRSTSPTRAAPPTTSSARCPTTTAARPSSSRRTWTRASFRGHGRYRGAGEPDHHRQGDASQRPPAQLRHRLPRYLRRGVRLHQLLLRLAPRQLDAATETHKDWAGKVRAFIGLELMGL